MLPATILRIGPGTDGATVEVDLRLRLLLPAPLTPAEVVAIAEVDRAAAARAWAQEQLRTFLEGAWAQLSPDQQADVRALLPEIESGLGDGTVTVPPGEIADAVDRLHELAEKREADELQARCANSANPTEDELRHLTDLRRRLAKRTERRIAGPGASKRRATGAKP